MQPGLATELPYYFGPVPSTGIIGRMFGADRSILSAIIWGNYYSAAHGIVTTPLIQKLYDANGSLNILNVGCGGCADIPYLEHKIHTILGSDLNSQIINLDKSKRALSAVRDGSHPYWLAGKIREGSPLGDFVVSTFQEGGVCSNANYNDIEADYIGMKKEVRERLNLVQSDCTNIPFPDNIFDLVIFHYVEEYLSLEENRKAIDEMKRVTRTNGFLFPHAGLYQKQEGIFRRVSGAHVEEKPTSGIYLIGSNDSAISIEFPVERGGYPESSRRWTEWKTFPRESFIVGDGRPDIVEPVFIK